MAIITLRCGRQMVQVFAHGDDAIVATGAGTDDLQVIYLYYGFPQTGRVTIFTDIGAVDMVQSFANSRDAVMTTCTATDYLQMIHRYCWFPDTGGMAVLTDVGAANVVKSLASGGHAIVAATTSLGADVLVIKVRR